jgi:hypothetical protein
MPAIKHASAWLSSDGHCDPVLGMDAAPPRRDNADLSKEIDS